MSYCGHLGFFNAATSRTHVRFIFPTNAAAGGNVAPNSAFEAADIRIYRAADGAAHSATQRSSAAGITMTSPFDTLTGVHEVDIDLTENTDAGFYAAGYFYTVVLSPDETVDSQTITGLPLCTFEIGVQPVNVTQVNGSAASASTLTEDSIADELETRTLQSNLMQINGSQVITALSGTTIEFGDVVSSLTQAGVWASGTRTLSALGFALGASDFGTDWLTSTGLAASAVTEIQSGLATAAAVSALNNISTAQVLSQVEAALDTTTRALPGQMTPSTTPTLAAAIMQIFQQSTNPYDQNSSVQNVYNRAAAVVHQKRTVSDNGTLFALGALVTGP